MYVAPCFQSCNGFAQGFAVIAQAVLDPRRYFGVNRAFDDAVGFEGAQLGGQCALRYVGKYAADFVETQDFVAKQAVKNRAFPFAADDGECGFYRTAFVAAELPVWGSAHGYLLSNYLKNKCVLAGRLFRRHHTRFLDNKGSIAMKAIGFNRPLPVSHADCLLDIELPEPELHERDVLVEVRAVSVNPADVKVRASHRPEEGTYRVLGWDAAGVVVKTGSGVRHFRAGDEVYFAGAINRQGSYAERVAVDERIVAAKPQSFSFAQAAALPLTTVTAWETLFDRLNVNRPVAGAGNALLIIGGAGGVGSIAVQLAKQLTDLTVIATASRPESRRWCLDMGADFVINHHERMAEQMAALDIGAPAFVFSTNHTDRHLPQIVELIAPQGRIALIDDPAVLDACPLKSKSLSLHWEFMFTRPVRETADMAEQGRLLAETAKLADTGRIRSTLTCELRGINAANLRRAHEMVERGDMVGKVVVSA